jgi:hypothetical protein
LEERARNRKGKVYGKREIKISTVFRDLRIKKEKYPASLISKESYLQHRGVPRSNNSKKDKHFKQLEKEYK